MRVKGELTPRPKGRSDEAIAKRKEAVTARHAEENRSDVATDRQDIRAKRDEWRTKGREEIKKIRSEETQSPERRAKIQATKAYHKTDKDGNPGGFAAVGALQQKLGASTNAATARKTTRTDKTAARNSAREAKKAAAAAKLAKVASMKEKKAAGTYLTQDTDFFKRNAKQRGMSVEDYYAKYVK